MKASVFGRLLAAFAAAVFLLAAVGCGGAKNGSNADRSLEKVLDAGQLVLGLDTEFPPMGFIDEEGEIVGFDIDVAEEVCRRLGVKLVKQGIDWDEKEDDLNSGKIDCIWNGLSVDPEREKAMNLSDPYMKNELIFVVLGSSDVKGMDDLFGKTIGVQSGSTALNELKASEYFPNVSVKAFNDNLSLLNELASGDVDVALVDSVVAYYYIFSSEENFFVLPDSLGEDEYAIGFRKGDQKLRDRIQEILSEMKTDGTLGSISKKWFGSDITTVR